ncbi:DUF1642 domain-containing protein [Companilactobacillus jidongensis]|uniref:DUF1642 domain-containing protein n=1 Tax=Companilactobacillus jidongensis TaxID=2486006 RepID=UPI000F79AF7F|nr:DUF1642 domain-containing protein [Companilactobacillus jidongensis]
MSGGVKILTQLYYVQLINNDKGYLNYQPSFREYFLHNVDDSDKDYKTKFTMQEIKNIDERFVPFAIPVYEVEK